MYIVQLSHDIDYRLTTYQDARRVGLVDVVLNNI